MLKFYVNYANILSTNFEDIKEGTNFLLPRIAGLQVIEHLPFFEFDHLTMHCHSKYIGY